MFLLICHILLQQSDLVNLIDRMISILFLVTLAVNSLAISLPPLLGDNYVGIVSLELVDYNRSDPLAPSDRPRDLMISVFYPVRHIRTYSLAKVFTPLYAAFLDESIGLPPGTAETIDSQAYASAYLNPFIGPSPPNVIIFSPGYGTSRLEYTAALSNLASNGYIVIGVDHPYDTSFIDYPDGRTAIRTEDILNGTETEVEHEAAKLTEIRAADVSFVLDILSTNSTIARKIPGLHGKLDVSNVGIFGHSLGGAAAATAMLADSRFSCQWVLVGQLFQLELD